MVLYLKKYFLTESLGFLNPSLRVARERTLPVMLKDNSATIKRKDK
jgi:hypothetical protein